MHWQKDFLFLAKTHFAKIGKVIMEKKNTKIWRLPTQNLIEFFFLKTQDDFESKPLSLTLNSSLKDIKNAHCEAVWFSNFWGIESNYPFDSYSVGISKKFSQIHTLLFQMILKCTFYTSIESPRYPWKSQGFQFLETLLEMQNDFIRFSF